MHASFRTLVSIALTLLAIEARAELYCVGSPAQLVNAISAAQGGGASEIRVRSGTYNLTATAGAPALSIADTTDLIVSGGWNVDCSAQVALGPDMTVLNAQNGGRLLDIVFPPGSSHEIAFALMSFRGGVGNSVLSAGCVYAESLDGAGALLRFDLVSFRQCSASPAGGSSALRVDLDGVQMRLRNSLLVSNDLGAGSAIFLRGLENSTFYVSNNTIANNLSSGGGAGLSLSGLAGDFFWLSNNIVWGNGASALPADLFVEAGVVGVFNNNLFGATNTIPAGVVQNGTSNADPRFVGAANYRLSKGSPARNSGVNSVSGGTTAVDFALAPRLRGGRIDRGAYEFDEFFIDGFE